MKSYLKTFNDTQAFRLCVAIGMVILFAVLFSLPYIIAGCHQLLVKLFNIINHYV